MNETVKEWVERTLGADAAEDVPESMTWNGLFLALSLRDAQQPSLDEQTQEKCLWRLSEILHVSPEQLAHDIERRRA